MINIELKLNDKQQGAFYLYEDEKKLGEMVISISNQELTVYHTEVAEEAEGKGFAKLLLDEMVTYSRSNNLKVIALCPYVHAQFKRHPELFNDIWKKN